VLEHKLAGEIKNWEITDSLLPQITEEEVYKTFGDTVKAATHAHQIFLENMKEQRTPKRKLRHLLELPHRASNTITMLQLIMLIRILQILPEL